MQIRKTVEADLPIIGEIYENAKRFMRESGNLFFAIIQNLTVCPLQEDIILHCNHYTARIGKSQEIFGGKRKSLSQMSQKEVLGGLTKRNKCDIIIISNNKLEVIMQEKTLKNVKNGMAVLVIDVLVLLLALAVTVVGGIMGEEGSTIGWVLFGIGMVVFCFGWIPLCGLRVLKPQEALVLTLFGKYIGTLKGEGFYAVHPFCGSVNPAANTKLNQSGDVSTKGPGVMVKESGEISVNVATESKKISLKIMTLNNNRQKINDCLGNPVEIGIAVTWRIVDTAKAVFNVDNYKEFLSLQCDSALRNVVRIYPYDVAPGVDTTGDGIADEGSLRGSSDVVADRIRGEIQARVEEAGIEIVEARITYLAYAPEIAAVMLQRQQASAIIDARKMIVDGAVGMVEMALDRLSQNNTVVLDDERKAAMVSNLLVVLCGNRDAQPVVNSGSLY